MFYLITGRQVYINQVKRHMSSNPAHEYWVLSATGSQLLSYDRVFAIQLNAQFIISKWTTVAKTMDVSLFFRTCSVDVPLLIRYGTCAGHLRDMCGTSPLLSWLFHRLKTCHPFAGHGCTSTLTWIATLFVASENWDVLCQTVKGTSSSAIYFCIQGRVGENSYSSFEGSQNFFWKSTTWSSTTVTPSFSNSSCICSG